MIVRAMPPDHWPWIASRAQLVVGAGFGAIEAVEDLCGAEGPVRIVGAVAFDGGTRTSCNMHIALDEPIALRRLLKQAFGLAFIQCGLLVACAIVKSTNARSLALCDHLGFREVFRGRDYFDRGVDMVLLEMRREQCKWIPRTARNPAPRAVDHVQREAA